jgi:hypothetical protein
LFLVSCFCHFHCVLLFIRGVGFASGVHARNLELMNAWRELVAIEC